MNSRRTPSGSLQGPLARAIRRSLRCRPATLGAGLLATCLATGVPAPVLAGPFPATVRLSHLLPAGGGDGADGFALGGLNEFDLLGYSVSGAGDVNGDGLGDLIVGAPTTDAYGNDRASAIYVVFGRDGGFSATPDLSALDGTSGFVLTGAAGDYAGACVAGAGDINGDGIDDLLIGNVFSGPGAPGNAGETFVVFGRDTGFPAQVGLASLDGSTGFVIAGIDAGDFSGSSVAFAGDVNGDGLDDVIVGAPNADPDGRDAAGESYVVFGRASGFAPALSPSTLDGTDGFVITGITAGDNAGTSVAGAGDVNGDGLGDLIIGARRAGPGDRFRAGQSYVVFGRDSGFPATLALSSLDGTAGFALNGILGGDQAGQAVSGAGDVNGDGLDDVAIGAPYADPGGRDAAGESYVVFGRGGAFPAALELASLDGTNGVALVGSDAGDLSGGSVSAAGDLNGDGLGDLLVGAWKADPAGESQAGESYVVYGRDNGFPASLDLASVDGADGFVVTGVKRSDYSGFSISGAGDINGDGRDDLAIGAWGASRGNDELAGESYVLFGRADVDGDGIDDSADNCPRIANGGQVDSDDDGIGNACDADIDNDCTVDFSDLSALKAAFHPNPYDANADFDSDGLVNFADLAFMKYSFFDGANPGPGPGRPGNACEGDD